MEIEAEIADDAALEQRVGELASSLQSLLSRSEAPDSSSVYVDRMAPGPAELSVLVPELVTELKARHRVTSDHPGAEPGLYSVVLQPPAVADIVRTLGLFAFGANRVRGGTSPMTRLMETDEPAFSLAFKLCRMTLPRA